MSVSFFSSFRTRGEGIIRANYNEIKPTFSAEIFSARLVLAGERNLLQVYVDSTLDWLDARRQ